MFKKIISLTLTLIIAAFVSSCEKGTEIKAPEANGEFKISILKIGKADAIILKSGTRTVLIDCGEKGDADEILEKLSKDEINEIDTLFITHFDKDHVGGAAKIIKNIAVKSIVTPNYNAESDEYADFLKAADKKEINVEKVTANKAYILGDVLLNLYPPLKSTYREGDNDFSLCISATHGKNRFLFTGDAEEKRISEILIQAKGKYDFLKVPHHGRFNEKTETLVKSTLPLCAAICDSEKNPAEDQTLSVLEKYACETYCTKDGDITVSSDGNTLKIFQ